MKKGTTGQASIHMNASPEQVYALVTDVQRMGEWSPECRHCEWLDGATGPAVGARFKGSNKNGLFCWSTKPSVVTADHGGEFSFVTSLGNTESTRWTSRLEADADDTKGTEAFM